MDDIVIDRLKESILTNFKNKILKISACLPQHINVIHAVANNSSLLWNFFSFVFSYHAKNLARSSPDIKSSPYYLGSG